jgi:hypothetical protein
MLGIVGSVLLGCLVVIDKSFSTNEIVALALLVPMVGIRRRLPERAYRSAIALSLAVVIVVQGLQPWRFLVRPQTFNWVPFQHSLSGSIEVNYTVFPEKCFWYTALVWLLTRVGLGVRTATILTALLLLMIEVVQVWLPDRSAEITDPILAIMAGICIARLSTSAARESTAPGSRYRH